jgi:hypothetical protein
VGTVSIVTPDLSLAIGDTATALVQVYSQPYKALGSLADASTILLTDRTVTFGTGNASVFTVNGSGVITPVGVGTATLTATCEGVRDTITITVTTPQAALHHVNVTPATQSVTVGGSFQVAASPEDVTNTLLTGQTVTWGSSNPLVCTVGSDSGNNAHTATVTAVGTGSCTITATCGAFTDTCVVTVSSASSVLFLDTFTGGGRASSQNGISYGAHVASNGGFLGVTADAGNASGYSLEARFLTPSYLNPDGSRHGAFTIEEHIEGLGDCEEIYVEQTFYVDEDYYQRQRLNSAGAPTASSNNKLLRLHGQNYSGSAVHVGMSVLPFNDGTGSSKLIAEWTYLTTSGGRATGNATSGPGAGPGPWTRVFMPGTETKIGFYCHVASGINAYDGTIKIWVNDALVYNYSNLQLNPAGQTTSDLNRFRRGYLLGAANSGFGTDLDATNYTPIRIRKVLMARQGPS